jgi:hypothetical protein
MKTSRWVSGLVLIIAVLLIGLLAMHRKHAMPQSPNNPAMATSTEAPVGLSTSTAPWAPEIAHLRERLAADSLPALSQEGTVLHIHQHLDMFIHGQSVPVPPEIGINEQEGYIAPIHVHDTTGIIHVESPYEATFTLGQFFDIWGVRFTDTCIGGYCSDESNSMRVYVNGKLYQGDPRQIVLTAHQEIAITFGTPEEEPKTIPSAYSFPAGL